MEQFFQIPNTAQSAGPASANSSLVSQRGLRVDGSKTLAGMLLAAAMAALLVVAEQVIDTWADGHLLAGWVALWTVAFAALALLATPMRRMAVYLAAAVAGWRMDRRIRRQNAALWDFASTDQRQMAELQAALARSPEQVSQPATVSRCERSAGRTGGPQAASRSSSRVLVWANSGGRW